MVHSPRHVAHSNVIARVACSYPFSLRASLAAIHSHCALQFFLARGGEAVFPRLPKCALVVWQWWFLAWLESTCKEKRNCFRNQAIARWRHNTDCRILRFWHLLHQENVCSCAYPAHFLHMICMKRECHSTKRAASAILVHTSKLSAGMWKRAIFIFAFLVIFFFVKRR